MLEYYVIIMFLDRKVSATIHVTVVARNNSATKLAKKMLNHFVRQSKKPR